jgi:hypothetical protein
MSQIDLSVISEAAEKTDRWMKSMYERAFLEKARPDDVIRVARFF